MIEAYNICQDYCHGRWKNHVKACWLIFLFQTAVVNWSSIHFVLIPLLLPEEADGGETVTMPTSADIDNEGLSSSPKSESKATPLMSETKGRSIVFL